MKKLFTLMVAVAAMISFTACEKDDNGKDLPNILKIGDKTYPLGAGTFRYIPIDGNMHFFITLADKVYWDKDGNTPDDGNSIYANAFALSLYTLVGSGQSTDLQDGKYTFSESGEKILSHTGTALYVLYDKNGNVTLPPHFFGQSNIPASQLEIEIKHIKGNIYEIKFTGGIDESGNPINGYYKGVMDKFEMQPA